jgi:hypothetical protein
MSHDHSQPDLHKPALGRGTATRTTGRRIRGTMAVRITIPRLASTAAIISIKPFPPTPTTTMQRSITVVQMAHI